MNNPSLAPGHCTGIKKSDLLLVRLQGLEIEKNCRDWRQYIKAKRVAEGLASSPDEYEFLIKIITNYLSI